MIFSIGNLAPAVKPTVSESPLVFGEEIRGQSGAGYSTVAAVKLSFTITFPRLTREEANLLKRYATAPASSPDKELIMNERGRVFDGVTYSGQYGRILNKVKVVAASFDPVAGRYDDDTDEETNTSLESASATVEEI